MGSQYFPAQESEGGWRRPAGGENLRALDDVDLEGFELARREHEWLFGGESWSVVVVHHGYVLAEWASFNVQPTSRFDVWSCTKAITSLVWGMLLARPDVDADLNTPVCQLLPAMFPLSDERKRQVTLRHLLTMTSGIKGEAHGVIGVPTSREVGPLEHAFGHGPNRHGLWTDRLSTDPGMGWDYSDPGYMHLGAAFSILSGMQMDEYAAKYLFDRIGVEQMSWDRVGGGGFLGPVTNAHTGLHLSAIALARIGYLLLRGGRWDGAEIVPAGWLRRVSSPSQRLNQAYGYGFWTNKEHAYCSALPADTFLMAGFRGQRCYVIPSRDLVVVRLATGPSTWAEPTLIGRVVAAIRPGPTAEADS